MRTNGQRIRMALCVLWVGLLGCGDDSTTGPEAVEMVTISGTVVNIDSLVPAQGVRVWLLDTDYSDEVATGSDGGFLIQIPKGSPLLLVADDFDELKNEWIPLINVEYPPMNVTEDLTDWIIHACPYSVGSENGSVASWDNYLANADDANGDLFATTATAAAGGVVVMQIIGCNNSQLASSAGFSVTIDAPEFPEGYVNAEKFYNASGYPDPSLGPDIMYPGSHTITDDTAVFVSFGHPRFEGHEVTLNIEETDPVRGMVWEGPVTVPVRRGWLSVLLPAHVDGTPNVRLKDFIAAGCL